MTKQEFLAMSLPYGLKCSFLGSPNKDHFNNQGEWRGVDYDRWSEAKVLKIGTLRAIVQRKGYQKCSVGKAAQYTKTEYNPTPIIRSIDDINKPCVQENYNNGKPFVPIVELAKEYDSGIDWGISEYGYCINMKKKDVRFILEDNTFYLAEDYDSVGYIDNTLSLYQKLIRFHFWPNMKKDEDVIYVTDDFNPYK